MLQMLMQWYRRRFSDPEAIALLVILLAGFGIMFFFSGLLAPLLVSIVLAYLLEWPTVRLERIGFSRTWATSVVLILFVGILLLMAFVVMPVAWQQGIYLIRDMPGMLNKLSDFAATVPRRYPALMDAGIIDAMAENMRSRMLTVGDSVVKYSLASLVGLLTLAVYLVLAERKRLTLRQTQDAGSFSTTRRLFLGHSLRLRANARLPRSGHPARRAPPL